MTGWGQIGGTPPPPKKKSIQKLLVKCEGIKILLMREHTCKYFCLPGGRIKVCIAKTPNAQKETSNVLTDLKITRLTTIGVKG